MSVSVSLSQSEMQATLWSVANFVQATNCFNCKNTKCKLLKPSVNGSIAAWDLSEVNTGAGTEAFIASDVA